MHTEVDVPNPNHVLLPGLYAEATLALENKSDAISVPLQALDQANGKTTVDVVDASGRIEVREIKTGIQTPNAAEVVSGVVCGPQACAEITSAERAPLRASGDSDMIREGSQALAVMFFIKLEAMMRNIVLLPSHV